MLTTVFLKPGLKIKQFDRLDFKDPAVHHMFGCAIIAHWKQIWQSCREKIPGLPEYPWITPDGTKIMGESE